MKQSIFFLSLIISLPSLSADTPSFFTPDETIKQIIATVAVDTVWTRIEQLQKLERYTTNAKVTESVTYLTNYMKQLRFDSVYQQTYQSGSSPNIIGIKKGSALPDEIYITCAHYDSYAAGAPAADDNGSGTAGVLEAARVMLNNSYKRTIKFILFSGEEIGLKGSAAYAKEAKQKQDKILGVINMDMISWNNSSKVEVMVAFQKSYPAFYNKFCENAKKFIPSIACVDGSSSQWVSGSDHKSFWDNGYKDAIYLGDDLVGKTHPYFHKSTDVVVTASNSKPTAEMFMKAAVANLAALAEVSDQTDILLAQNTKHTLQRATIVAMEGKNLLIAAKTNSNVQVEIYALNGQMVYATQVTLHNLKNSVLSLASLPIGVYTVKLSGIHLTTQYSRIICR